MNDAGAARQPFLFAVDFELREGLFVEEPLAQTEIGFAVAGRGNKGAFLAAAEDSGADHEALLVPDPMPGRSTCAASTSYGGGCCAAIRFRPT